MKNKAKLLSLILASSILLTACGKTGDSPTPTSAGETSTAFENTEKTENTKETTKKDTEETSAGEEIPEGLITDKSQYPTDVYDLNGELIKPEEMTQVFCFEQETGWAYGNSEGFVYLAEPTGISYNSVENADIYDSANNDFSGSETKSPAVYKRYYAGDEICGLVVDNANTTFNKNMYSADSTNKEIFFSGGSVTFKGEKELTGYIIILAEDIYVLGTEGDIVFVPDNQSQTLPVMNYNRFSEEEGVYSDYLQFTKSVGDFTYKSEYEFISLGNISEYGDMFMGEEKNKALKAKVTIENIWMSSSVDWYAQFAAKIKSLEFTN